MDYKRTSKTHDRTTQCFFLTCLPDIFQVSFFLVKNLWLSPQETLCCQDGAVGIKRVFFLFTLTPGMEVVKLDQRRLRSVASFKILARSGHS